MNNFAGVKINNFSPKILIINICLSISLNICFVCSQELSFIKKNIRDQARGRLGRNSRPRGRNFALNDTQGEVGVSLKKKKKIFFFFFRETHFHSVTTQMQAVVTLSDNLLPLHRVSPSIKWQ